MYLFAISVIRHLTCSRLEVQSSCWVAYQPGLQHSMWKENMKRKHLSPSGRDQTEKASNFIYDVYNFSSVLSNFMPPEMLFYNTQRRHTSLDSVLQLQDKQKIYGMESYSIQQGQVFSNPFNAVVLQGSARKLLAVKNYRKGRKDQKEELGKTGSWKTVLFSSRAQIQVMGNCSNAPCCWQHSTPLCTPGSCHHTCHQPMGQHSQCFLWQKQLSHPSQQVVHTQLNLCLTHWMCSTKVGAWPSNPQDPRASFPIWFSVCLWGHSSEQTQPD